MAAGSSSVRADILWLCRAREPRRAGEAPAAARGGGRGRSSREAPALCTRGCGQLGKGEGDGPGPARCPGGCGRPERAALAAGWGRVGRGRRRSRGPAAGGGGMGASSRRSSAAAGRVVARWPGGRASGRARARRSALRGGEYGGVRGDPEQPSPWGRERTRGPLPCAGSLSLGAETERSPASVRSRPLPSPLPFSARVTPA